MADHSQSSHALARLLAADIYDVAAGLLVATFRPGARPVREFRKVHVDLAEMADLKKPGLLSGATSPEYGVAVECALLWQSALLAAQLWAGDSASRYVQLLRRGEAALAAADPYTAVRTALTSPISR